MKHILLFTALMYSAIASAQPASNGDLIKQELMNRITALQTTLNAEASGFVNFSVGNYQMGDKAATANLAVTLTSPISKKIFNGNLKLDIIYGPEFMLDNVKTKGLALINSTLSISDRDPAPFLQLSTVLDKDSPDWKINLIFPAQHLKSLLDWDGAKGQVMLRYNNNKIVAIAAAMFWQKLMINIPGQFQFVAAPFNFKGGIMMQDENNSDAMQETNLSEMQLSMYGQNAFSFKSGKLSMNASMKNKVVSTDRSISLVGVQTDMLGELKSIPNASLRLQLKNISLDLLGESKLLISNFKEANYQQMLSQLLPNSEVDFDVNIETNLGNISGSVKLTLNSVPKNGPDLLNVIDVNVSVFVANKLVASVVNMANDYSNRTAMYQAKMNAATSMPPTQAPVAAQKVDMMDEINNLVKSGVLVQTEDGYTFSFIKQNQKMQLNGNEQSPYLNMLRSQLGQSSMP